MTIPVLALLLCEACISAGAAQPPDRPNILLALGDNWSWPHAGILGDPVVRTPVFDRIAREGVLFRHAFCPVPSCSPTRSSMLTGRVAHQLEDAASLWSAFPQKLKVFTEMLEASGYEVGFTGKGWSPGRHQEYGRPENPAGRKFTSFGEFMTKRDPAKPFFFWHGDVSTALHQWRYNTTGGGGPDPARIVVPPMLPDTAAVRADMLAYYAGAEKMDASFGKTIALLEKAGALESTAIFYTSDNGWQMPRGLANCYDTGTRVPLAVRWGSRLRPGREVEDFVSLTDLAPTFLQLAGLQPAPEMTGRSFADVLLGMPAAAPRDHVFVERERHANVRRGNLSYPIRGVRTRGFLYLWNIRADRWPAGDPKAWFAVGNYGDVDGTRAKEVILARQSEPQMGKFHELSFGKRPGEELYDLAKDPAQLTNVAGREEYAAAKKELRARVEQWMRDTADPRVDPACDVWDHYPYFGGTVVDKDGNLLPRPRKP
ncbi:MAG: sulfatase [Chthoniobacteraceae bacterium]